MKNRMFFGTWILDGIWKVLGGVWEAKILNFRAFFHVFSMLFCKRGSEAKKSTKMGQQDTDSTNFGLGSGDPQAAGERKRIGVRTLQIEMRERMSRLANCDC